MQGKITVVGLGPGHHDLITPQALNALKTADVIIGYKYYFTLIESLVPKETCRIDTGMTKEVERAKAAFQLASEGKNVAVISSGDAGIYGMAPLVLELSTMPEYQSIPIDVIPGISALQAAAAKLGAPVSHDFCAISLSDLLTPWSKIEARIEAAAKADFVTAIYNPKSHDRYWQIHRFKELFLRSRSPKTPVGIVRQACRNDESITLTTLNDFNPDTLDMFCTVIVGNSQSFSHNERFITPRGYFREETDGDPVGQSIMKESFRRIEALLQHKDHPYDKKWAIMHTIHSTADFDLEQIFYATDKAIELWHNSLTAGGVTIITDVTMALSGLRKAALKRHNIEAICYLNDPRVTALCEKEGITRSQAGIRLAAKEHPEALFVIGNAPTALIEVSDLLKQDKIQPLGIVAAPVGFVNVVESKLRVKAFQNVPKVIIEGQKGGSTIAATIVNAAFSLGDAGQMTPGRDV